MMETSFEKMFKSDEEVKQDILQDFATDFLAEIEALVAVNGKEMVMRMITELEEVEQVLETTRHTA